MPQRERASRGTSVARARGKTAPHSKQTSSAGAKSKAKPTPRPRPKSRPAAKSAAKSKSSATPKPAAKYSDPALRERLKRRIHAGSKGGSPGQWSARKAQLLAHEYEQHGGRYRGARRTPAQRSLQHWSE